MVLGLAVAVSLYVLGLAHYQAARYPLFSPDDLYLPRLIDVVMAGGCFWIGSSLGSFLNVVAWRMPRGESINGRSHCPRCHAFLRARDNFPVFGWLRLAGRCHSCRLPISARYPIVETAVGLSLALIAIGQLYRLSLPGWTAGHTCGPLWAPLIDRSVLITLLFHVFAITISWAFALVRVDGHPLPGRLVAWGLIPLAIAMIGLPPLGITTWRAEGIVDAGLASNFSGISVHVDALLRVLTALAAAAVLGRSLSRGLCPTADLKLDPLGESTRELMDLIAIIAVPALIFGWQSTLAVVVIASLLAVLLRLVILRQTKLLGCFAIAVPLAATLHLFFWNALHHFAFWPSDNSQPPVILSWAAAALVSPLWLRQRQKS